MSLVARASLLVKSVCISALALLLLLAPWCGAPCHAQMCDGHRPAPEKRLCHESAAMGGDSSRAAIHSTWTCNLHELPSALLRWQPIRPAALTQFANGVSPAAVIAAGLVECGFAVHAPVNRSGSGSPHPSSARSSSSVLRI